MTALTSLAGSFGQLALARVGVGVGEAGCSPPAHSLISDLFPIERRATALAIYSLGIPIGGALGSLLGGWLGQLYGWRVAFLAVGLPGVVLSLVVRFTLREPPRAPAVPSACGARRACARSSASCCGGPPSCTCRSARRCTRSTATARRRSSRCS